METTFEVILKNGKPFVRMTCGDYVVDMKIWKAKTDAPYVKYMSTFNGYVYLSDDMKAQLANLI